MKNPLKWLVAVGLVVYCAVIYTQYDACHVAGGKYVRGVVWFE